MRPAAAPPALTSAQRDAPHTMFEHVINTPTVIGRHKVPEMAQYVADQFKAGGFPAADVHVMPYHTGSATTGEACLANNRRFMMVDDNPEALEVMARRFEGVRGIRWVGFDPRAALAALRAAGAEAAMVSGSGPTTGGRREERRR